MHGKALEGLDTAIYLNVCGCDEKEKVNEQESGLCMLWRSKYTI